MDLSSTKRLVMTGILKSVTDATPSAVSSVVSSAKVYSLQFVKLYVAMAMWLASKHVTMATRKMAMVAPQYARLSRHGFVAVKLSVALKDPRQVANQYVATVSGLRTKIVTMATSSTMTGAP
jgi:hypothetical protein